jgi:alanine racemase
MRELLWMEIDLKKIKENILNIQKETNKKLIPVIKSNAYNLGDLELAKLVKELDLDYAAVVDLREAIDLLSYDDSFKILILNSLNQDEYEYLNNYPNLAISLNNLNDITNFNNAKLNRKVNVHLQIDTGMNRLGFTDLEDFKCTLELLKQLDNVVIEGIYTHFSSLNNSKIQLEKFKNFHALYPFKMVHLAASSTYKEIDFGNYVRVGLDVYGSSKNNQAIKVVCYPIAINHIKKGDSIGYNEAYLATNDMKIAVLPIGYANGFRRSLGGYKVMVDGKLYNSVGNVCMNHLFIEINDSIDMNSQFIITSPSYPIEEMAKYLNTISHEILCMLNIKNKKYIW